jgi:hypothetical protein
MRIQSQSQRADNQHTHSDPKNVTQSSPSEGSSATHTPFPSSFKAVDEGTPTYNVVEDANKRTPVYDTVEDANKRTPAHSVVKDANNQLRNKGI